MVDYKSLMLKWTRHNKSYYKKLGIEFTNEGDLFELDVNKFPQHSRVFMFARCDLCGRPFEIKIENYNHSKNRILDFDACPDCMQIKAKMACKEKYGVDNIFKLGDYIKQKNKEKHNGLHHTQTEEFKERYLYGEKNREYIDGRSQDEDRRKSPKEKAWRKKVYARDNYTCQCCGDDKGHNLNAHHILPYMQYPKFRFDVNNGITLCEDCHKEFHRIYGKRNIGKKEIDEFISNKKCND